ncbi:GIY-YIG nuclease family protein [Streptomyces sp. NPDC018972]|uniref:GIY-YIG nuclease family protein n=1 Tax=Streptomyces sp. NPDC018972 TaxID=3365060 RepID=UPI00378FA9CF
MTAYQSMRTYELRRYAGYSGVESFPGYCYFLLLPGELCKIGYSNTEETLKRRIKDLTRELEKEYGPGSCEVLAVIKGGYAAEAVLHHRFRGSRIPGYGERFHLSDDILDFLATAPRLDFSLVA